MKVIHIIDNNGLNACADKTPKERTFNFSHDDTRKITCKNCICYVGKVYFADV